MKNIMIAIVLLPALCGIAACAKCKPEDIKDGGIPPHMLKYFGMYKPGNWWVYANADSSKWDSVYVTDYVHDRSIANPSNNCETYEATTGVINSTYFANGGVYKFEMSEDLIHAVSNVIPYVETGFKTKSIWGDTIPGPKGISQQEIDHYYYGNMLFNGDTYEVVGNVGDYNEYYYAPYIGCIKFRSNTDVFYLKRYKAE